MKDDTTSGEVEVDNRASADLQMVPPLPGVWSAGFVSALCFVAGLDRNRLQRCSSSDRLMAVRTGLQLCFSGLFFFAVVVAAIFIGIGQDWLSDLIGVMLGVVIVGVIILFDSNIIAGDMFDQGYALATGRGIGAQRTRFNHPMRLAKMLLRLCISYVFAVALTGYAEMRIYEPDINAALNQQYQTANATLFGNLATEYDSNLKRFEGDINDRSKRLSSLRADLDALLKQETGQSVEQLQLKHLTDHLNDLVARKDALERQQFRRETDRNAEQFGVKETAEQSGRKGEGPLWHFAQVEAQLAESTASALAARIGQVQQQIVTLQSDLPAYEAQRKAHLEADLDSVSARIAAEQSALTAETADQKRALADRGGWIQQTARTRPGYVPLKTGLIARAETFFALENKPAVSASVWHTKLFIMVIDLAAVLSKLLFTPPSGYALLTALDVEDMIDEEAKRRRSTAAQTELDAICNDLEVEGAHLELLKMRSKRYAREDAHRRFYSHDSENNSKTAEY